MALRKLALAIKAWGSGYGCQHLTLPLLVEPFASDGDYEKTTANMNLTNALFAYLNCKKVIRLRA